MTEREAEIAAFLSAVGWSDAVRRPLAGDASARRYDRLLRAQPPQNAVLMDAPVESGETVEPFLKIARFLRRAGLSAPLIYNESAASGLILMEDLGDGLYAKLCAENPGIEHELYENAVDVLIALHSVAPPTDLQLYSSAVYLREARLLVDWYLPAATGQQSTDRVKREFSELLNAACRDLPGDHSVCVLRDYHAENLLWLPNRIGLARVGQLDFQDALLGHPAYDLVSLLEDARRDTDTSLQENMISRYLEKTELDEQDFRASFAALGAQRNLKIIGIFTRLCVRDAKQPYVDLIPRVWAHLMQDLAHSNLSDLKNFVESHVPAPSDEVLNMIRNAENEA